MCDGIVMQGLLDSRPYARFKIQGIRIREINFTFHYSCHVFAFLCAGWKKLLIRGWGVFRFFEAPLPL